MIRMTCAEYGSCTEPATHFYTFHSQKLNLEQAITVCAGHTAHASGLCRPIDELVLQLRAQVVTEDALDDDTEVAP